MDDLNPTNEFLKELKYRWIKFLFTRNKQQAFLEDLSSLVQEGVTAPQAIATIEKISTGIAKEVAHSIAIAYAEGKRLAEGMEPWFPYHIVDLIRTGEDGGTLNSAMIASSKSLSEQTSILASIAASITYPLIVLALGSCVAVFLKYSIFANFLTMQPLDEWPQNGQMFMQLATFIEQWWWTIIIAAILFNIGLTQLLRKFVGDSRLMLDKIFPFKIYREIVASYFMGILGLLLSNGIAFKDALNLIQRKTTRYLAWHIYMMQFRLSGGRENIADVLDTGLIDHADILRLKVIAKGKNFDLALSRLGLQATEKSTKKLKILGRILGGFLLVLAAGFAVFMIFAIYGVGAYVGTT